MTRRWRLTLVLAAAALGAGACGDSGGGATAEDQSIVVIHVNLEPSVPALHQIRGQRPSRQRPPWTTTCTFPTRPGRADPVRRDARASDPHRRRMGLLDLIVFGLDAGGTAVARGNGQTTIAVGERVDYTISLSACGGPCD